MWQGVSAAKESLMPAVQASPHRAPSVRHQPIKFGERLRGSVPGGGAFDPMRMSTREKARS
jgi:hypothetical protein